MTSYVHGYSAKENMRLQDQANTLVELLHHDTVYPAGSRILEAGCGVGSQTVTLARQSPEAEIVAVDISADSLSQAKQRIQDAAIQNVTFQQADLFNLDFPTNSFDHIFVCFVLEHLAEPAQALANLKRLLKPTGTITIIEGDHGSTYFHPHSDAAHKAIQCQVELQRRSGGNANIGRELFPLLAKAEFEEISVSPRMVYVDDSKPNWVEGFTRNTFTAMIEGVRDDAIEAGLISMETFDQGIRNLYKTAEGNGVFCYTFFKAVGRK